MSPKFIILTNPDNTDVYVNINLVEYIVPYGTSSKITTSSGNIFIVTETPVQIQAKF